MKLKKSEKKIENLIKNLKQANTQTLTSECTTSGSPDAGLVIF